MMDHGVLNVPLAKRGDIDRQIDAYKKAEARAERLLRKEQAAVLKKLRPAANAKVMAMPKEELERVAGVFKISPAEVKKSLLRMAYWEPNRIMNTGMRFIGLEKDEANEG